MTNKIVHSLEDALIALGEVTDRVVVVSGPLGSGLLSALLSVLPAARCLVISLLEVEDWNLLIEQAKGTVILDDFEHASDRMRAHVMRSVSSARSANFIFRVGLVVPGALAAYPRVTLTRSEP